MSVNMSGFIAPPSHLTATSPFCKCKELLFSAVNSSINSVLLNQKLGLVSSCRKYWDRADLMIHFINHSVDCSHIDSIVIAKSVESVNIMCFVHEVFIELISMFCYLLYLHARLFTYLVHENMSDILANNSDAFPIG